MKKIPTIFERDWNGNSHLVIDKPHPDCGWVFAGEGTATQKLDGTSCMIRDGKLFKRRELKAGQVAPVGYISEGMDAETGKTTGWVPVGGGPEDAVHREAFEASPISMPDGTYELLGPKVQGNPEHHTAHVLCRHSTAPILPDVPRDFGGLCDWLSGLDIEGVVWHHPDGRMAKIKLRDFGLRRTVPPVAR